MNLFTQSLAPAPAICGDDPPPPTHLIEIVEPDPENCPTAALPPEGNVKFRNYRLLNENLRAYTPTGDINTTPSKGKVVSKFDVCSTISPPRARILELLRPEDPGREALEAIVRPAPRRGLTRPLDEDTRRFLQRALQSPSPIGLSAATTPEPQYRSTEKLEKVLEPAPSPTKSKVTDAERSLADELREAEEEERAGGNMRRELLREFRRRGGGIREAVERDRLGKLALAVEEDESESPSGAACALSAAARRLDALLAESRDLHDELAGIHEDMQVQSARACRCAAAARALAAEARALRYLDDVVAMLRGDLAAALRAKAWPFARGPRQPGRNYVI